MVAACEKHHVKCAIAHQTRYSPRLKVVKQLIADGKLGDLIELRGRGKEDARGGGQDLMVLGTHILDLMRLLVGDARWCFARIWQDGKKALAGDVRQGGEGMGPIQGDKHRGHVRFRQRRHRAPSARTRRRKGLVGGLHCTCLGRRG